MSLLEKAKKTFPYLLSKIKDKDNSFISINGLAFRNSKGDVKIHEGYEIIKELDIIQSPYTDLILSTIQNKIVYYESSRGCPFSCSYCLSSTFNGVRYFSIERVKKDLLKLIKSKARQIKFVDRTFNCNKQKFIQIIEFIIQYGEGKNFHFEVAADLFDDQMIEVLKKAPKGLIQFEIGIQTTNHKTLKEINRVTDLQKVYSNINKIKELENIHLHVDLIAGLPFEDLSSFKSSFNTVYNLRTSKLQLGFLKMLKGTCIKRLAHVYEYKYRDYHPYEILSNKFIKYSELKDLKRIEDMVEKFHNSGWFQKSIDFLVKYYFNTPYNFFESLSEYYEEEGYFKRALSIRELFCVLINFSKQIIIYEKELDYFNEILKYDYLYREYWAPLPKDIKRNIQEGFKESCFKFLYNIHNIEKYLPEYKGMKVKDIIKQVHFELFKFNVLDTDIGCYENTVILFNKAKVVAVFI